MSVTPDSCAPADASAEAVGAEALPPGKHLLRGQYEILGTLGQGGFGLTYLARDSLARQVVIKECFPAGLCQRDPFGGCAAVPGFDTAYETLVGNFLREAHLQARPEHPNIVPVHQVFREGGTAYIAMAHIEGADLLTLRHDRPEQFTSAEIYRIAHQALSALDCLHGLNMLHRDISPDNILMDAEGHLTLIDFGAACGDQNGANAAMAAAMSVKDGYSPHELYAAGGRHQPASDLYALGATLYFLVTGTPPVSAETRLEAFVSGHDDPYGALQATRSSAQSPPHAPALLAMIDKALALRPEDRFLSATQWLTALPDPVEAIETPYETEPATAAQAPQAPAPAESGEPLQSRISDLVAETNTSLEQRMPKSMRPKDAPQRTPKQQAQLYDIFGDPITDLDAFIKAQDEPERRHAQTQNAAPSPHSASSADPTQRPKRIGLLRRLFGSKPV